jgi:serine/threonine protein kinase
MEQILGALDYLASGSLIHMDVKPDNDLYLPLSDGYLF